MVSNLGFPTNRIWVEITDLHSICKKSGLSNIQILYAILKESSVSDYNFNHDPQSYVLTKLQSHDIVFLGTTHKQPPILEFISDLIPKLNDSRVTHIGQEIASEQHGKIDHFMNLNVS